MYWKELDTDTKARLIRDGLRMGMGRWEIIRDAYDAAEDRRISMQADSMDDDGDIVIDDPMGQWAYPGEVTRIPSNRITMRDVPYPVVGVSDTGDTRMMEPEGEYVFDGSEVTEFPVRGFQQGGPVDRRGYYKDGIEPKGERFEDWYRKVPSGQSDTADYDLRAAYSGLPMGTLEAWRRDNENNHLPDTYKKPVHDTFSNESVYSGRGYTGGVWVGDVFYPSQDNRALHPELYGNSAKSSWTEDEMYPDKNLMTKEIRRRRLAQAIANGPFANR